MTKLLNQVRVPVVVALLALVAGCGGSHKGAKAASDASGGGSGHAEVGKPAPDLSIQTLNGKGDVSLESLRGKVVIVDFWATWCAPCKTSFPKLEELSKKVGDKVEIVGISVDDEKKGVVEFAKESGATFAIGWDEGHKIASKWKIGTMPTTFVVDGSGTVRYIHDGYHEGETKLMEKEIATLAEEGSANTKVARNDDSKKRGDEGEKKTDGDVKSEGDKRNHDPDPPATAASSGVDEKADVPPPPKKSAGKKGAGRAGGKTAPAKKHTKKKSG